MALITPATPMPPTALNGLPSLWAIDKALAEKSLVEFTRQAWHIVEPGNQYIHGWHIDAICEHLEAATRFEIRNLVINIPPRCMKSLLTCVMWPAWVWTTQPATRWMFASYAESLSIRDSLKCRRIVESKWYRERWGDVVRLTGDQNQKTRFENDRTGFRLATSVGGQGTGEGGQFLVVDDGLKAADSYSDAIREEANRWWLETMSTRGNDPKRTARVIIMQRLHDRDLTGTVTEMMQEGGTRYEVLCLPMRYEPNRCVLTTGWADPRGEAGELLWPERFDEEAVTRLESELGDQAAAQLQQRPVPAGGGIFKAEWWGESADTGELRNRFALGEKAFNTNVVARWQFWDTALKDADSNDYSACATWELTTDYRMALTGMWQERIQAALLPGQIEARATAANWDGKLRGVVIEDKGSGTTAIQTLRMSAPVWLAEMIREFTPHGTKEYRARQASIWCERDCVLMPVPGADVPWLFDFADPAQGQLFRFPAAAHDDMVDAFVMGIIYLEHLLGEGWRARQTYGGGE